jgi:bifunctional non-homologous end joining protein LigD
MVMAERDNRISHYIQPMLATAVDKPFNNKEWLFELKLDGYRAVAEIRDGEVLLYSRNGLSLAEKYKSIVSALRKMKTNMVLDGEIVMLNEDNRPDFQKLQNYKENKNYPLIYYVFDLLSLKGVALTNLPLVERKQKLKKLIKKQGVIRYSDHIEEYGIDLFKMVKEVDQEGIMAKKIDSYYMPGARTKDWLKIKYHKTQEAIIVGFTQPKGSRLHFGSLLLAQYKSGKLQYIGNAGTGFTDRLLIDLMKKMKPLISRQSPFDYNIKSNSAVTWVKPLLVCEVAYSEMTKDGMLRHPVYKGLRPEKNSQSIRMETEHDISVSKVVRSHR